MTRTIVASATREIIIGFDQPFCVIGERINPTGRKKLAAEMVVGNFETVIKDALEQAACGATMPSFKSHFVSFVLRYSRKQAFSSPENLQRWIAAARKTEDHHPPASLHQRLNIQTRTVDGFPVYEIAPRAGERKRILYLHDHEV